MSYKDSKVIAVILMAGESKRTCSRIRKQYEPIGEHPLFWYASNIFDKNEYVDGMIFVVDKENEDNARAAIAFSNFQKPHQSLLGSSSREASAFVAIEYLKDKLDEDSILLFHDADRPYLTNDLVNRVIEETYINQSAIPTSPVRDSLISLEEGYIDRNKIRFVQTPQGFRKGLITSCFEKEKENLSSYRDEGSILEDVTEKAPNFVEGEIDNAKITTGYDLAILKERYGKI